MEMETSSCEMRKDTEQQEHNGIKTVGRDEEQEDIIKQGEVTQTVHCDENMSEVTKKEEEVIANAM